MDVATFKQFLPKFDLDLGQIESILTQLLENNLAHIEKLLDENEKYTWDNLLKPIEDDEDVLNKFWSPISHLNSVMNSDELRIIYEKCLPKLSDYGTHVAHNKRLYNAIESIKNGHEWVALDNSQQKIIDNQLRDFKLSGVTLDNNKKAQFAAISKSLSELTNKFSNNVLDATLAWTKHIKDESKLAGLPDMAKKQLAQAAELKSLDGFLLNLEMPNYFAIMTYADHRDLRQEVYTAYSTRASDMGPNAGKWDNSKVMHDILVQRLAMAQLLDFDNYAERSLSTKMVKDTRQVLDFLNELAEASLPSAQKEFAELGAFAREELHIDDLQAWDVLYVSEKLRQAQYNISQDMLRPYFPVDKVTSGLFTIVNKLFNVSIEEFKDVDVWHKDVKVYVLKDVSNNPVAAVYFDLFARSHKRGGAWMDEYQVRRQLDEHVQLPIAYVTCNFAGPVGDAPALLEHNDVVTLFHEFGHALQHMLTEINYADVSGINGVPWDAVEVASQFLENWAWQRESLDLIACHYQTGEKLPDDLFDKMLAAKNFQSAMQMMRQLEFALFDFELHLMFNAEEEHQIQGILDRVRSRVTVVPVPEFNRFQHGFSHIFAGGYAAGYYSYKWAEVMAADAFELFLENGIFDTATSNKFKNTFLARGGAEEPADLFEQFRGRAPQVQALLKQSGILADAK